jgi:hypothetical protein
MIQTTVSNTASKQNSYDKSYSGSFMNTHTTFCFRFNSYSYAGGSSGTVGGPMDQLMRAVAPNCTQVIKDVANSGYLLLVK